MPEPYSLFFLPQSLALLDRAPCTRAERSSLLPLIEALIRLGKKGRLEGVLALEDEIDFVANDLLHQALVHSSMGVDPDDFTERLVTKLLSRLVQGLSGDPQPLGDDAGRIVAFGDLPDRLDLELGTVLLSDHRLPMKDEESYPRWVSVLWAGGGDS